MKKVILGLVFMFILSMTSYGQIAQGNFLLGGTGNVIFRSEDGTKGYNITLAPRVGYFVTENIVAGLTLPLIFGSVKNNTGKNTGTAYGLAPFARYYFAKKEKSAFFGLVSLGFLKTRTKYAAGYDFEETVTTSQIGVGYVYFLNQSIGLESSLTYNRSKQDDYDADANFNLNFGIQIYFGSED